MNRLRLTEICRWTKCKGTLVPLSSSVLRVFYSRVLCAMVYVRRDVVDVAVNNHRNRGHHQDTEIMILIRKNIQIGENMMLDRYEMF